MTTSVPESVNPSAPSHHPWPSALRALSHGNFRLFVAGQICSLLGTWMQQMAMSWLVYRLTGSVFLLGLIAFLGQVPGFFTSPVAGLLADRFDRRKLLITVQVLAMGQALALAALSFSNQVAVWHVLYLSAFMGIVNGIDIPVRHAFVSDMLDCDEADAPSPDLGNAISINSSVFNGARLIGPAVAGMLIASVGERWCFLLNALSYIPVMMALVAMKLTNTPARQKQNKLGFFSSLREGYHYAYHTPVIRMVLAMVGIISLIGLPYSVLMPHYAKDILHGGPQTLGFLMGSAGAGAFIAAVALATRSSIKGLERLIPLSAAGMGLALVLLAFAQSLQLALPLLFLVGLCMILTLAGANIMLQTLSDSDKRGRVLSLFSMSFLGVTPVGNLLIGFLASRFGFPAVMALCGLLCLAAGLLFLQRLPTLAIFSRLDDAEAMAPPPLNPIR